MSKYKIYLSVGAFLCIFLTELSSAESSAQRSPAYISYIERWQATALAQQEQYGIPAAITLAQGLLESGAGQSDLATIANNHFGIKCHNTWDGKTYHKDDDARDECFRSYQKAEDSFRDHSLFLKRPRYEVLFTYNIKDYKKWAYGLKECGYATDPKYPQKLITIIETYGLNDLKKSSAKPDKQDKADEPAKPVKETKPAKPVKETKPATPVKETKPAKPAKETKPAKPAKKTKPAKPAKKTKPAKPTTEAKPEAPVVATPQPVTPPVSTPAEVTDTVPWTPSPLKTKSLYGDRAFGRTNGRRFIVAQEGDTWGSIAYQLGMEEKALRRINEAGKDQVLRGGDRLYFLPKRSKADKKHKQHLVQPGETAWDIAQRYGMKMSSLYKLNGIPEGTPLKTQQWIELR